MREEGLSTLSAFLLCSVLLGASYQVPIFLSISPSILPEATASPGHNRRAKPVATCMTYNRNDRPCSPHVTHARASTITIPPLPRNNNPQQQHTFTLFDHHSYSFVNGQAARIRAYRAVRGKGGRGRRDRASYTLREQFTIASFKVEGNRK
jgi:hypothetical protein